MNVDEAGTAKYLPNIDDQFKIEVKNSADYWLDGIIVRFLPVLN